MTCDESKLLLSEYWSHTLGETEELAFEAHIATCDACRRDAEQLGALWRNLALIPGRRAGAADADAILRFAGGFRHGLESAPRHQLARAADGAVAEAAGLADGGEFRTVGDGRGHRICGASGAGETGGSTSGASEVAQLRGEVSNMRQMVALSLLQQQSAGERLRGVSYAYRFRRRIRKCFRRCWRR